MQSRKFLNVLLLVMVVILLWATTQAPLDKNPNPESPVFNDTSLKMSDINHIRVQHPKRETLSLRYYQQQWRLELPRDLPADLSRIQRLLKIINVTSSSGFRAAGNDLSQYGLNPAKATLSLNDQQLDVGNREPLSGKRYVRLRDQVHLIDDQWSGLLFAGIYEYVSPRLLPDGSKPIMLQLPQVRWDYYSEPEPGDWKRQSKLPDIDDSNETNGATLAMNWSQAKALLVQSFKSTLPWQGDIRIAIQGGSQELIFQFAKTNSGVYVGRQELGLQYLISKADATNLLGKH